MCDTRGGRNNVLKMLGELVKDKKVLVLGYGREGKSTLHRLLEVGGESRLAVADANPVKPECLTREDGTVLIPESIVGEGYLDCLNDFDYVFKTPGIVLPKPAEEYTCRIVSETEIFFEKYRGQIIGITGTKGKSTTTTFLYHVLKTAGKNCVLAGNIGIPVFDMIEEISEDTVIVVELSCHQLEYMQVSPKIAVLLNLHEEHLDHYGTMEKYVQAKRHVFLYQKPGDLFFCGEQCQEEGKGGEGSYLVVGDGMPEAPVNLEEETIVIQENGAPHRFLIEKEHTALLGHHNYYDMAFVYGICRQLGITDEEFRMAAETYKTLPHRLQFVGCYDGVKYYDDSISTIGDTAIQALQTLEDTDTILLGGMDRGIDYTDLREFLSKHPVPYIILMEETGRRIYREMMEMQPEFVGKDRLILVEHLEDAVKRAKELTRKGRSCVLSPASASYGIFKNFEERGEVFQKLVAQSETV